MKMRFAEQLLKNYRTARAAGLALRDARAAAYKLTYSIEALWYAVGEDEHYNRRYWNKPVPLARDDNYYENSKRAGLFSPCAICGRPIKNERRALWIRLNTSNQLVRVGAEIDPDDDMGAFPVGYDCYTKHPELKSFAVRST